MNFARCVLIAALVSSPLPVWGLDHISLERDGKPLHLSGKIVVEADDGGVLLLAADGVLWMAPIEELQSRKEDPRPFKMLDRQEMSRRLAAEMPGFRIHQTAHYLVCYNTSQAYAEWCGALYERLHRGFFAFWSNQGIELQEPEFPLVALVFRDQRSYADYAKPELADATDQMVGYYSPISNRVVMHDLTGIERLGGRQPTNAGHVNQLLLHPRSERNVATIVHEATHQLVHNSGLQQRYADIPRWLSEGMATYFETPDLNSKKGWRSIGEVNHFRLTTFQSYLRNRPENSLQTLLTTDQRFHDSGQMLAAYGEAWALNYFLMRHRTKEYLGYLRDLAAKVPFAWDTPEERLAEFKKAFGDNLKELDAEFLRASLRIR